jgi:hypothetical protein
MPGFLDIFSAFADPKNAGLFEKAARVFANLDGFMAFSKQRFDHIDARLAGIDGKLVWIAPMNAKLDRLLDETPIVTPEIHAQVLSWAADDPRQREVTNGRRTN